MKRNEIYKLIQEYLKDPPVIIWGSGATIACGLPSMNDLNNTLKAKFSFFDKDSTNLENELGKTEYEPHISEIRKCIWECIAEKDVSFLNNILEKSDTYIGVKKLIEKFTEPHPNILNIITTNYDRVLENTMALNNISYTDGFSGRLLFVFDEILFSEKKKSPFVKLIKVHGSLNWFYINGETRYFHGNNNFDPKIISPGKNKFQEAFAEPYRTLIQNSDEIIKNSRSLLVVGFGFNDEHLTPQITTKIKKGCPIVILTKQLTDTTKKQLENASFYLCLEESECRKTKISYKKRMDSSEETIEVDGDFWQLNNFMEAL